MKAEHEDNGLDSMTSKNNDHNMDSISIDDSVEDNNDGGIDEKGVIKEKLHHL